MNSDQRKCINQVSAAEAYTQQRMLNRRWGDTVGNPLVLTWSVAQRFVRTHLHSRRSPLSSMARGALHLPRWFWIVPFCHARYSFTSTAREQFTKWAVSEMLPPFARKPMIMPFSTSDKSLRFCITPTIAMFYDLLGHPLYTLHSNVLPPAFCDWLFHSWNRK
jgi:hypothetical protein